MSVPQCCIFSGLKEIHFSGFSFAISVKTCQDVRDAGDTPCENHPEGKTECVDGEEGLGYSCCCPQGQLFDGTKCTSASKYECPITNPVHTHELPTPFGII